MLNVSQLTTALFELVEEAAVMYGTTAGHDTVVQFITPRGPAEF